MGYEITRSSPCAEREHGTDEHREHDQQEDHPGSQAALFAVARDPRLAVKLAKVSLMSK